MYVLVFSSDSNCRRFCVDNLVIRGYLAAGLASPREAALLLQNAQPSLIVVCVTSPREVQDHEMIRKIKNVLHFASVPLLLMGPEFPDPDWMEELGIDAYIPEGKNVQRFMRAVELLLKSQKEQT